jgi:DNA-binding response OmpR family regulator
MKLGALDDLYIPFDLEELLAAIRRGSRRSDSSGLAG